MRANKTETHEQRLVVTYDRNDLEAILVNWAAKNNGFEQNGNTKTEVRISQRDTGSRGFEYEAVVTLVNTLPCGKDTL